MENKKKKILNILLWGGLGVLMLFVVITSMIVYSKQKEYNDIKHQNELIPNEEIVRIYEID